MIPGALCGTGRQYNNAQMGGRRMNRPDWLCGSMREVYRVGIQPHPTVWTNQKGDVEIPSPQGRGVLRPGGACTKVGSPVREVLQECHTSPQ